LEFASSRILKSQKNLFLMSCLVPHHFYPSIDICKIIYPLDLSRFVLMWLELPRTLAK